MPPKKQLINLSEQQKSWITSVVSHSLDSGQPTNQTEIIRALVDHAMVQDPEAFLVQMNKIRLRAKLDDIQRRKKELREEEERLAEALEKGASVVA
jgi:hypothetical protein